MPEDTKSLAHTKWNCKYHIVFAPKYRRKVIYGQLRADLGAILRELCRWKGVNILKAEMCVDHVHMLVEILSKIDVFGIVRYLKRKRSLISYEKFGNLKFRYRNRKFCFSHICVMCKI